MTNAISRVSARMGLLLFVGLIPACASAPAGAGAGAQGGLLLSEFHPRSMLQVPVTEVTRARFPVIDVHQHLITGGPRAVPAADIVAMMDAHNISKMVHLTGGFGQALQASIDAFVKPFPDRFVVFALLDWSRIDAPDFGAQMAELLRDAVKRGARGLKILKNLGLGVRDKHGKLIAIDDTRLDPAWAACGELGIPVAIHTSDPAAFFTPVDGHNERYDELQEHPDWVFLGKDFPTKQALLEARDRVFERHPGTTFIALHVGNWPENLDAVEAMLRRFPNVVVEIGARHAELGRQPRRARRFFLEFSDRILFGTDISPTAGNGLAAAVYRNYFRFLETEDEAFDYYGGGQGRWTISGLHLPDEVLERVYHENAERIFAAFKQN